jgi:MFS family permease
MSKALTPLKASVFTLLGVILDRIGPLIFLPDLPAMALALGMDKGTAKMSIAFCLLGIAVSQLFSGYLADLWGMHLSDALVILMVLNLLQYLFFSFKKIKYTPK